MIQETGDFPLIIQLTQVFLKLFLEQLSGVARSYKRGKGEIVYIGVLYIMPFQVFFPVGERDRLVLIEMVIVEVVAKLISGCIGEDMLHQNSSVSRNREIFHIDRATAEMAANLPSANCLRERNPDLFSDIPDPLHTEAVLHHSLHWKESI